MNNLKNILKKEIKEMFRDKKSLMMMLIIPLLIPLMVVGISLLFESEINKSIENYNKIGFNYELSEYEKNIAKNNDINVIEMSNEKLKEEYKNGNIHLYVIKKGDTYIINGENNDTTSYATSLVENYFNLYKQYLQKEYLTNNNINSNDVINIIKVEKNIIEKENFYANYVTVYAFLFIIMAITVSATYPSTNTTAGEKERGTLETLLTFPIKSKDIIIGKFLSVTFSSIITGVLSLILAILSLIYVNDAFTIYNNVNLMLPMSNLIYSLVVIVAYSFLISGLCIALASKCKTFKEAQSTLTPLTFISFFPGMIVFMANIKSTALLSLVPFINYNLLFQDISSGNINIVNIILMLLSTIIIIAVILVIIIKQYKSEKVLFNN